MIRRGLVGLGLAAVTGIGTAIAAGGVDEFYADNDLKMIIGSSPGGGYDIYARTLSSHLSNHVPGRPNIIPMNMPGAGSAKAAGYLYSIAEKDGSEIGTIFPGAIMDPLVGEKHDFFYSPSKFNYLGTLDNGTRLCLVNASSATKTFEDAQKRKTVLGASQAGGSTRDYAYMLNNLAKTKFDIVSGYKGSAQILLAMQRGEVEGMCGYDWSSLKSARPEWIRDKKVNILLQVGTDAEPTLSEMGIPQLWNYIADPEDRKAAELIVSQQIFNRPFVAPPGVPADRLKALREAFIATTKDPAFIKDASTARIDLRPLSGERVQKAVADLYASPPEIVQKAAGAMRPVPHT